MSSRPCVSSWPRRSSGPLAPSRRPLAKQELAAVRATAIEESEGSDFGQRAEQILRLAESQARETRTSAARESSALLERTHAEAESHRRKVAGELTARYEELDRKAAQREAALDERERQITEAAEAERREIEHLRSTAVADADRIRHAVLAAAEEIRRQATAEAAARMRHLGTTRGTARSGEPEMLRTPTVAASDDRERSDPQG
jgi:hypothetical protein